GYRRARRRYLSSGKCRPKRGRILGMRRRSSASFDSPVRCWDYFFFSPPPALVPPFGFLGALFEPGPLSGIVASSAWSERPRPYTTRGDEMVNPSPPPAPLLSPHAGHG